MTLTHFSAVVVFAAFTSIVFGITQRAQPRNMIRFGAITFATLVLGTVAASWLMFFIKR